MCAESRVRAAAEEVYQAETVVLRYHLVQGFNVQAEEED